MNKFKLGIDIGSTTVKIAVLDDNNNILFSDYERHFANIQETLQSLLEKAVAELGEFEVYPVITGSGGLTLAKHLEVPFTQEVVAVSTAIWAFLLPRRLLQFLLLCRSWHQRQMLPSSLVVRMPRLSTLLTVLTRE